MPDPQSPSPTGIVVPHRAVWHQRLAAWLIYVVEWLLTATLRFRWDDRAGLAAGKVKGPVIFCLWHNRLALCMRVYQDYARHNVAKNGLAALISASKDGALLEAALKKFGVQAARGSSSRRGAQAILEMTSWLEQGYCLAITPDGPRGPRYQVQPGVMALAQVTGVPVIPVSYRASRKFTFKSWDRFQLPQPFARCEVIFGEPIIVPRDITDEERLRYREQLQKALMELSGD